MTQEDTKTVTKVVITLTGATGFIGIQAAECDPYFTSVEIVTPEIDLDGEEGIPPLQQVLDRLPEALDVAQARWREQARNPAYERPVPEVRPASATTTTPARTGRQTPSSPQRPLL